MPEGADDTILIEVPKGSHHITWRHRGGGSSGPTVTLLEPEIPRVIPPDRPKWFVGLRLQPCWPALDWRIRCTLDRQPFQPE
jgi:hypothetical protein